MKGFARTDVCMNVLSRSLMKRIYFGWAEGGFEGG